MVDIPFTSSLRFRLTAAFVVLIAVGASLMGMIVSSNSRTNLLELHERNGTNLARNIARGAEPYIKTTDSDRLSLLLKTLQQESFVRYATVFNPAGELLAIWFDDASDVPPSGKVLGHGSTAPVRDLLQNGAPITEFEVPVVAQRSKYWNQSSGATDRLTRAEPLEALQDVGRHSGAGIVGFVRLGLSKQPILDRVEHVHTLIVRLVLAVIVLGGLASFIMVRSFLQPITRLIDATRMIGQGNFDTMIVSLPRGGELSALSRSLSGMARALRNMKRELVEANTHLERKVTERTSELQAALDELKVLDRMKDEFLSSVSHEFRTPLTSIRAYAEILLEFRDEDTETRLEFLDIIIQESERLTRLVNDILDMVKIESGEMEWSLNRVDVLELAENAIRSLRPILDQHNLKATITRRAPLPPIRCDSDRIFQVMNNLLSNAIKFSHEGDSVEVTASKTGDAVEVVIINHGIGIEPMDQQKIFDRFKQAGDTLTAKPHGTGLGLPICRNIVERHGGSIWVESKPNHGSRFHFTLPIAGPTEDELRAPTQQTEPSFSESSTLFIPSERVSLS